MGVCTYVLGPLLIGYDRVVQCRNRRYSSGGATVAYFVLVGVWLSFTPLIAQVHTMKIYCAILALNSIFYVIFNCCEARTVNCTRAIEHRNEIAKCFLTVSNYDADLEVCVRSSLFTRVELLEFGEKLSRASSWASSDNDDWFVWQPIGWISYKQSTV